MSEPVIPEHVWRPKQYRVGGQVRSSTSCQICGETAHHSSHTRTVESWQACRCGHNEGDHEATMDSDGYPHDYEQFCMGSYKCECSHFSVPEWHQIPERIREQIKFNTITSYEIGIQLGSAETKIARLESQIADTELDAVKGWSAADAAEAKVAELEEENAFLREGSRHCNEEHGSSLNGALKAQAEVAKQAATIERLTKELDKYKPHCGHTILSDNLGRVYGCGKLDGHDGPHETVEERRAALSKQEPK